jgi:2-hydroxychromene-2-carboxylate isomerase
MEEKLVIDYYLTVNSPWSYMGASRLAGLADRAGCRVNVFPTRFAEVFEKTGGLPLNLRAPARKAYRQVELARWKAFLELAMNVQPAYFPVDDSLAAHAIVAAQETGENALALSLEIGRAQWEMEQDISHMGTLASACRRAGVDLAGLGNLQERAEQFDVYTRQAVARGVFGYPTYIYDGELFWGQDRLDFLARKVLGS